MSSDSFSPPFVYWHQTTIGRLESILKHGLLSANEAHRRKMRGYRRMFKSSWNDGFVSLMSGQSPREATAPGVAVLVNNDIKVISAQGKQQDGDTNKPVPEEVLVKDKILPKSFIGIVIGEVGYSFRLEKPVKPHSVSQKKVIEIVRRSGLNLPVYFKGKQICPR